MLDGRDHFEQWSEHRPQFVKRNSTDPRCLKKKTENDLYMD